MATSSDIDALSSDMAEDMRAARELLGGGHQAELPPGLEALRKRVDADLDREKGLMATLRDRPTPQRIALVLLLTGLLVGVTAAAAPRGELADYPIVRMAIVLVALSGVTGVAIWRLLRPLHLPKPSTASTRLLLVAGVLAPTVAALWPLYGHVGHDPGHGMAFAVGCGRCMAFGAVMGAPVLALATLMRRSRVDGAAVVALAGVAAGLVGNLTLQLHCPVTDPIHLLLAHASLALILGVVALRWR